MHAINIDIFPIRYFLSSIRIYFLALTYVFPNQTENKSLYYFLTLPYVIPNQTENKSKQAEKSK